MQVTFDDVDDPELDLATARIVDGKFMMDGYVELGFVGAQRPKLGRHRLALTVAGVESFTIHDKAGAGVLILERIQIDKERVLFSGVIPAELELHTVGVADVRFEAEEIPFEVRRRFNWVPA